MSNVISILIIIGLLAYLPKTIKIGLNLSLKSSVLSYGLYALRIIVCATLAWLFLAKYLP